MLNNANNVVIKNIIRSLML